MYTLKGELKVIGDVQQISDSFKKREFVVVDSSSKYEQTISLQAVQDRTELLDKLKVGDNVEVTFFLRGREWTNPKGGEVKYFNSLDAWKIEKLDQAQPVQDSIVTDDEDSLPF